MSPSEPCTAGRHGDRTAYTQSGCRCPEARADKAAEKREYRKRRVLNGAVYTGHGNFLGGHLFLSALGSTRRLQALNAIGYSLDRLKDEMGYKSNRAFTDVMTGRSRTITPEKRDRISDVYDRLSMIPGPSRRAKLAAQARGYAPPLAWDEDSIDDPRAAPDMGAVVSRRLNPDVDEVAVERFVAGDLSVALTKGERAEVARRLAAEFSTGEAQRRLGMSGTALYRALRAEEAAA